MSIQMKSASALIKQINYLHCSEVRQDLNMKIN